MRACRGWPARPRSPRFSRCSRSPTRLPIRLVMALCLHKGLAKTVVEKRRTTDPPVAGGASYADPRESAAGNSRCSPSRSRREPAKGITPASAHHQLETAAVGLRTDLLTQYRQRVLVEEFLPGREFTVGLIGTGHGRPSWAHWRSSLLQDAEPGVYSYTNKERCEELVEYRLVRPDEDGEVRAAEEIALAAWQALNCRDAGRHRSAQRCHGRPHFLEANPLAGMHPSHSDLPMLATALGIPYLELIRRIVESAAR